MTGQPWVRPSLQNTSDLLDTAFCQPKTRAHFRQLPHCQMPQLWSNHSNQMTVRSVDGGNRRASHPTGQGRRAISVAPVNRVLTIETRPFRDVLRWIGPMRKIVLFLSILLVLAGALIVNPWIWPNPGTATYDPPVASPAPWPGQELPSAPPSSISPTPTKVATGARSVHGIARRLGDSSTDSGAEETVALMVSNPYRPHWTIEW